MLLKAEQNWQLVPPARVGLIFVLKFLGFGNPESEGLGGLPCPQPTLIRSAYSCFRFIRTGVPPQR